MKSKQPQSKDVVLVSWISIGGGAGPLVTAINHPKSPYRSRVARVYLCYRNANPPDGERERAALKVNLSGMHQELDPHCPDVVQLPWTTKATPTDHEKIKKFAEGVLQRVRKENPEATIAIHLSPGTPAMHAVWLVLGTTGFVSDPVELLQTTELDKVPDGQSPVRIIQLKLDTWLHRYRSGQPQKTRSHDDGHVWDPSQLQSTAMKKVLDDIDTWAPLRVPVLLLGERGTGKTTLANLLRARSPFQTATIKEWPVVVCGQFRSNLQLARSELFGHVKGAFTDANETRHGRLKQADGDTLFLDEIADMDRETQRLLMAAIEGRGFHMLGDNQNLVQSQFRLICATNRSIGQLRDEYLDLDFLDRIATVVIRVPSLRECIEDLPYLWDLVLRKTTAVLNMTPPGWDEYRQNSTLLKTIQSHRLPGNFRDLQRAAYHLLAALNAQKTPEDVLKRAVDALGNSHTGHSERPEHTINYAERLPIQDLGAEVEAYEHRWIEAALAKADGNISKAARLLGMERKTLEYKVKHRQKS